MKTLLQLLFGTIHLGTSCGQDVIRIVSGLQAIVDDECQYLKISSLALLQISPEVKSDALSFSRQQVYLV